MWRPDIAKKLTPASGLSLSFLILSFRLLILRGLSLALGLVGISKYKLSSHFVLHLLLAPFLIEQALCLGFMVQISLIGIYRQVLPVQNK